MSRFRPFLLTIAAASLLGSAASQAQTIVVIANPGSRGDVEINNITDFTFSGAGNLESNISANLSDNMQIVATPAGGSSFDRWQALGPTPPYLTPAAALMSTLSFTADGLNYVLQAVFKQTPNTITVNSSDFSIGGVAISNLSDGEFASGASVQLFDVDPGEVVRTTATASNGVVFLGWLGNPLPFPGAPGPTGPNPVSFSGDGNNYIFTADFGPPPPNQVTFTIISKNEFNEVVGNAQPYEGFGVANEGEFVSSSVTTPWPDPNDANTRFLVQGFTGAGSIGNGPGSDTGQFQITNTTSVTWDWQTQFRLSVEVVGNGSVQISPAGIEGEWYTNGQAVFLLAVAAGEDDFQGFSGDVNTPQPTTTVFMTSSKDVTATFGVPLDTDGDGMPDAWEDFWGLDPFDASPGSLSAAFGDPDCDGLPNIQEYFVSLNVSNALFDISPIDADSDGDGMDDGYEALRMGDTNALGATLNINSVSPVATIGVHGPSGNADNDFFWNTDTGYETEIGLTNWAEYEGPDIIVPGTYSSMAVGLPSGRIVRKFIPNPLDTGDQSFSNTEDSEIGSLGEITGDGFDDGFEFSWDFWQGKHGGDPAGDPLGHRVPDRFGAPACPVSVAVFDSDSDGIQDLAVANFAHDQVAIIPGIGGGLFGSVSETLDVGDGPSVVRAIDANNDGNTNDLIVANSAAPSSVAVIIKDGPDFAAAVFYNGGDFDTPSGLVIADFNGDGFDDFAACNDDAVGFVTVYTNTGDGSGLFEKADIVTVGAGPDGIAAGPIFNPVGDPVIDLVVVNRDDNTVSILQNDGTGDFTAITNHTVGSDPREIVLADFDNDDINDFAVVDFGHNDVRSYVGNGDGTFRSEVIAVLGIDRNPNFIAVGQFSLNTDTNLDVVVINSTPQTATVLTGSDIDHTFSIAFTFNVGLTPVWAEVADLDDDGLPDIVIVEKGTDALSVHMGNGNATVTFGAALDTSDRTIDRRFDPGNVHSLPPDEGRADFDLQYDPETSDVGDWLTDELEYAAWEHPESPILRTDFPGARRSSHPFFWDADFDRMPDGWEMAFGYDPWGGDSSTENPDGDCYAVDGALVHFEVYLANEYNPYVAYCTIPDGPEASVTSGAFDNYEEMIGPRQIPAVTPFDPDDTSTHPFKVDTDGDQIWDGWEWYVGINAKDSTDGGEDIDDDGLMNVEEFLSFGTSSNEIAFLSPLTGWANKILPTDPNDEDTDFDQVLDGAERDAFNFAGTNGTLFATTDPDTGEITYFFYIGGGLNPTAVDTDADFLPDAWERRYAGAPGGEGAVAEIEGGMDGTFADPLADPDGDGLLNYQEYMVSAVYHWQYLYNNGDTAWTSDRGLYGYEPYDFFNPLLSNGGDVFTGPGGRAPKHWDSHTGGSSAPFTFVTGVPSDDCALQFSSTDPGDADTDLDGMDDYWEVYHGMNPIFGVEDVLLSKILCPSVSAAIPDPFDPDIRKYPWIAGDPFLDPDQDELQNYAEAVVPNAFVPPPFHHTDPSPHWITDTSSTQSFVNLYYWLGDFFGGALDWWYWDTPAALPSAPSYLFSFEINEGFDSDNDNIADIAELVDNPAVSPGATDPQTSESPIKRRAIYLNGDAAVRTRHDYTQDPEHLRTFTVECWARPEKPIAGHEQILVERPMLVPQGNLLDATAGIRANFRLGLDENGLPFAEYNGASKDIIFITANATPAFAMQSNEWTHLAMTYGGEIQSNGFWVGKLTLYVDGEIAAQTPSSEIPANGWFGPLGEINTTVGFLLGAPVTMGSRDENPSGWIDNEQVWVGPLMGLNNESFNGPPDLSDFFHGWMDEVRIWDGARNQSAIRSNMVDRFQRSDAIFFGKLDQEPADPAISNGVPIVDPTLLWCFGFDDLPDPDHHPVAPDGFTFLNGRPADYIQVPWWGQSAVRSRIYDDYRYVPWIENKLNHIPRNPPRDTAIEASSSNFFLNTADPYGFVYIHGINSEEESHPNLASITGPTPVGAEEMRAEYNNALPLLDAEADEDVEMWDGGGAPATDPFDSDGDGLPDDWEESFGLDPLNPNGEHGATGDIDRDGLDNLAEYLAGTKPTQFDTDGDGVVDYFSRSAPGTLMFGEIYDDGDGMPRAFEESFPGPAPNTGQPGLDPFAYDAHLDPDIDGWSNLGEYLGAATAIFDPLSGFLILEPASTDPVDPTSFPFPTVSVIVDTNSAIGGSGPIRIEFYTSEAMDHNFVAMLELPEGIPSATVSVMTEGHLHEGAHWVIAYQDMNDNQALDKGEPAGLPKELPIIVGAGATILVKVNLTTDLPGYGRFSWPAPPAPTNATLYINNLSLGGGPTIIQREVVWPRNYFHEHDHWREGFLGLPTGSYVAKPVIGGILNPDDQTFFAINWQDPSDPVPIDPRGETFEFLENDFVFALDPDNTASFDLQVSNTVSGELMMDTNMPVHYVNQAFPGASNVYRCTMRFYPDAWSNGLYCWRLRARNPGAPNTSGKASDFSAWESFTLDILDGGPAASQIEGHVYYFGGITGGNTNGVLHTNLPIIVEAHRDVLFQGVPDGRDSFVGMVGPGDPPGRQAEFKILGLRNGSYFLVAYIDSNGNGKLDGFEPFGITRDFDFATVYRPRMIDLPGPSASVAAGVRIVIYDRDLDDDMLPDGWEWQFLASFGFDGADDPNSDTLTLIEEYLTGANPGVLDSDGDGLEDAFEVLIGTDPASADSDEDGDGIPSALEVGWTSGDGYDPYDAISNPGGGDLDAHDPDTDGDGVTDLIEVAGGSDPLDPYDAAGLWIESVGADEGGNSILAWRFHANSRSMNVTSRVLWSSNLVEWIEAPDSVEVMDGDSYGTARHTNSTPTGRFYRLGLSVDVEAQ